MRFPETTREGTEAHAKALRRLDTARREQRQRSVLSQAAEGTTNERDAAAHLAAADEQLAAREAWVRWVERGY
jgi:hypothetical protein